MRVTYFSVPGWGHINPTLSWTAELVRRGHDVEYYTTSRYADQVATTGAEVIIYPHEERLSFFDRPRGRLQMSVMEIIEKSIAYADTAPQVDADVIGYDSVAFFAKIWAKGHPAVFESDAVLPLRAPQYLRPKLLGEYWKLLAGKQSLAGSLRAIRDTPRMLNLAGRPRGISLVYSYLIRYPDPYVNVGLHYHSVPDATPAHAPGKVYVSLGTVFNADIETYRSMLEAIPYECVISAPKEMHGELSKYGEVFESVDQKTLFASGPVAAVTSGGINTLQLAIGYGVPVIVVPQMIEQEMNGELIQEYALGRMVKSPKDIPAALEEVQRPAVRRRLAELSPLCRIHSRVADILEAEFC